MEITQIILLTLVSLLGIPAGFLLKHFTKEEMKPGKRWFKIISLLSAVVFFGSMIFAKGDSLALMLAAFSFMFFISAVPLLDVNRR